MSGENRDQCGGVLNWADEFLLAAGKERIEGVVVDGRDEPLDFEPQLLPVDVLTFEQARPLLENLPENICAIRAYAWTATRVLFVHEYDSSFEIYSVPRNPTRCVPEWGGSSEWENRDINARTKEEPATARLPRMTHGKIEKAPGPSDMAAASVSTQPAPSDLREDDGGVGGGAIFPRNTEASDATVVSGPVHNARVRKHGCVRHPHRKDPSCQWCAL
jgi:hypothetical protein